MAVKANGNVESVLPEEIVKLLLSLGTRWGDVVDLKTMKVEHLSGAMTNLVYKVSWPKKIQSSDPTTVLVRLYGKGVDVFFDRTEEIRTFKFLSDSGYGPKLHDEADEGRIEEFLYARTLSAADIRDPEISELIATKMWGLHELKMPGSSDVVLWKRLRNWLDDTRKLCSPVIAEEFDLENLENEISLLEKAISSDKQKTGFCHNDLQYGNIMMVDKTKSITIIDYEYASYNPVAYDIANHFCEMAADYHSKTPHVLDFSKYPGVDRRVTFVRQYLSAAGQEPNDRDVQQLADDVEKYAVANHIFWVLWGIVSHHVNQIDFDYMEYARQRFKQYQLRKPEVLDVQVNSS